jgi:hypothetical protein
MSLNDRIHRPAQTIGIHVGARIVDEDAFWGSSAVFSQAGQCGTILRRKHSPVAREAAADRTPYWLLLVRGAHMSSGADRRD